MLLKKCTIASPEITLVSVEDLLEVFQTLWLVLLDEAFVLWAPFLNRDGLLSSPHEDHFVTCRYVGSKPTVGTKPTHVGSEQAC